MRKLKKEYFLKSILGISVGITLMMISYIGVFLIAGEDVFKFELSQIFDINILIKQLIAWGICGYLFFLEVFLFYGLQNKDNNDLKEHPYKVIFYVIASAFIPMLTIILILGNEHIFSENVGIVNMIVFAFLYIIAAIISLIKDFKDSMLVEMINRKIKERNK